MIVKEVMTENPLTDIQEREPVDYMASIRQAIEELREEKKYPAMRLLASTLNSFTRFVKNDYSWDEEDMSIQKVFTSGKLKAYQESLLRNGASRHTVSSYIRSLRAAYNRVIPFGSVGHNSKLFADVHTKVMSQTKRALDREKMNTLSTTEMKTLPERLRPVLAYFLLMFFFRGMPFIDLANLRKKDVKGDSIVYFRHKTGKQLTVRIPRAALALFEECKDNNPNSPYLFPILNGAIKDEWKLYLHYQKMLRRFNKHLATLANLLLPGTKISSYTARHTWATLLFHMGTSVGIISTALGHSSIRVTETYLKPFDNEKVDETNDCLIASLMGQMAKCNTLSYNVFKKNE